MSLHFIGLTGFLVLLILIFLRVPVAVALGLVGFVGYGFVNGWSNVLHAVGGVPLDVGSQYALAQLPLFLLMGDLVVRSGMSDRLYVTTRTFFTGIKGSEAYATLGASAGMGAVSGSSLAVSAMMTRVAIPGMSKAGYDEKLSLGSVAAGGTLGILIPPSIALVVYALIAEQSVPRLYAASLLPGLLLFLFYCGVVYVRLLLNPSLAPKEAQRVGLMPRLKAIFDVWEIVALFVVVVGGIYSGLLTATEAAAVGVVGAWLIGAITRTLSIKETYLAFLDTLKTSAVLFIILVGANIFTYFLVLTNLPQALLEWIQSIELSGVLLIFLLAIIYLILGTFLEAFGLILITVPIFLPLIVSYGFDPIWFGVFLVIMIEMGLITPPVGMNIFVIQSQIQNISLVQLYRSVLPFLVAPIVLTILIVFYPEIAMWLPHALFGQ